METLTAMLDSLRPADSARSAETTQHRRPTSKDILAGGYNCQREIPEPVECEFCGRKLYHEALVMGRTVLMFAPFPQRCTCDRAKAKWAEADAEEARQKAEAEKEAAQAKRRAKMCPASTPVQWFWMCSTRACAQFPTSSTTALSAG